MKSMEINESVSRKNFIIKSKRKEFLLILIFSVLLTIIKYSSTPLLTEIIIFIRTH